MRQKIEEAVAALVGRPLWASGRAADLQWFQLGERRTVTTERGESKQVGEYALHVQCAWRIVRDDEVVVASRDLNHPADESIERPDDFDSQREPTRRDRRIDALFEGETRSLVVTRVDVGDAGGLRIALDGGLALEVFPHDSLPDEHWRLFRPYRDEPHLVVTGSGITDG